MRESAWVHRGPAGDVRSRQAEIRGQSECCTLYTLSQYVGSPSVLTSAN